MRLFAAVLVVFMTGAIVAAPWALPVVGARVRFKGMRQWPDFSIPIGTVGGWRIGTVVSLGTLVLLTGALAPVAGERDITAVAMMFLLVVLLASALWGYLVGFTSAIVADLLLNFFFVTPLYTFTVHGPGHVVALVVFLAVAVTGASMLALLRRQLAAIDAGRRELAILLELSRQFASATNPGEALSLATRSVARSLGARRCDVLRRTSGEWQIVASSGTPGSLSRDEVALANRAIETGQSSRRLAEQTGTFHLAVGGRRPVRDTFVPFQPGGGEPGVIRFTGTLRPPLGGNLEALLRGIADEMGSALQRARLADQAKRAEAIERSDEFKSLLLASVSHDLRSPLTAIKAAVGSLRSDVFHWDEEDRNQFLATIESQTDRLTDTVNDLLDMSRLESGSVRISVEPVNARLLLQETVHATSQATAGRRVTVEAPDDLWTEVDYGLMLRAVANLVENAGKYSSPGGGIALRAESRGGRVLISVADEGPGIPKNELPRIFERFYRGEGGTGTVGTGLGLSIVKALVELNHGRVAVDSSDSGTTFSLTLPLADSPT